MHVNIRFALAPSGNVPATGVPRGSAKYPINEVPLKYLTPSQIYSQVHPRFLNNVRAFDKCGIPLTQKVSRESPFVLKIAGACHLPTLNSSLISCPAFGACAVDISPVIYW